MHVQAARPVGKPTVGVVRAAEHGFQVVLDLYERGTRLEGREGQSLRRRENRRDEFRFLQLPVVLLTFFDLAWQFLYIHCWVVGGLD